VQPHPIEGAGFHPAEDIDHPQYRWQVRPNTIAEKVFETRLIPEHEWQWGEMRG
jgi:hypothetical protein